MSKIEVGINFMNFFHTELYKFCNYVEFKRSFLNAFFVLFVNEILSIIDGKNSISHHILLWFLLTKIRLCNFTRIKLFFNCVLFLNHFHIFESHMKSNDEQSKKEVCVMIHCFLLLERACVCCEIDHSVDAKVIQLVKPPKAKQKMEINFRFSI